MYEIPEKHLKNICLQHPDLLLQHLDKTLATFVWTDETFQTYT
jgi:hypothetical protein